MPHVGTKLPQWLIPRINESALMLPDTDWYLEELYDFLAELDATVIVANYSRYVVDLNRPYNDINLYPTGNATGLCPINTFSESEIYHKKVALESREIEERLGEFWWPYHHAIENEITRIKDLHGSALLWDAHSIRSEVPRFFKGTLPHINLGTSDSAACKFELAEKLIETIKKDNNYSCVLDGRFKGGFITRHYGSPSNGVNAVQVEIAMRAYMDESSVNISNIDNTKADLLRPLLKTMMKSMLDLV